MYSSPGRQKIKVSWDFKNLNVRTEWHCTMIYRMIWLKKLYRFPLRTQRTTPGPCIKNASSRKDKRNDVISGWIANSSSSQEPVLDSSHKICEWNCFQTSRKNTAYTFPTKKKLMIFHSNLPQPLTNTDPNKPDLRSLCQVMWPEAGTGSLKWLMK